MYVNWSNDNVDLHKCMACTMPLEMDNTAALSL